MAKLQTHGVITRQEFQQAETEGTFIISPKVVCAYCRNTVTIHDNQYLYCSRHQHLKLSVDVASDYPAVPQEDHYREMHFSLSRLYRNQTSFDSNEQRKYVARGKGCPFCDKYMMPVDFAWGERFDASLLNQRVFCSDCGVDFHIKVVEHKKGLEMRFMPGKAFFSEDLKAALEATAMKEKEKEKAEIEKRPVSDQILDYLSENGGLGSTGKMIKAIGCSPQGFKNNVDKLIDEGKIKQPARSIYQLINPSDT